MGVAQLPAYGWSQTAASTPVLDALAAESVRFTQAWSMADGAAGRAAMMTGRYPMRNRVVGPAIPGIVAPTQLHPAEDTIAELLGGIGFSSAMMGRYDLGQNGPTGPDAPITACGLDAFVGLVGPVPPADSTVGGQAPEGSFLCGAPTDGVGACCFGGSDCDDGLHPFDCLAAGGVPLLHEAGGGVWALSPDCGDGCSAIDFDRPNGHYRWLETSMERGDSGSEQSMHGGYALTRLTEEADGWVTHQSHSPPWFCTVTVTAPGGPAQAAPPSLLDTDAAMSDCVSSGEAELALMHQLEAMDHELGEMFEAMDLGSHTDSGFDFDSFNYTNTWIILVGDNGASGPHSAYPFDADRAAGTLYQTGLWVPLMVAGPDVAGPGRACGAMANVADVFTLIAEIAELDLDSLISGARPLDGKPMLDLVTDVNAEAARQFNHADRGVANFPEAAGGLCVVGMSCEDYLYIDAPSCEGAGGVFYPRGTPWGDCCAYWDSMGNPAGAAVQSMRAWTVRNQDYKLIFRLGASCPRETACELEFYRLPAPSVPMNPGIESDATRVADCNRDGRVNADDLIGVLGEWGTTQVPAGSDPATGRGSFFDATQDGFVGTNDILAVIHGWSHDCKGESPFPMTQDEQVALGPAWNLPWYTTEPMDCLMNGP